MSVGSTKPPSRTPRGWCAGFLHLRRNLRQLHIQRILLVSGLCLKTRQLLHRHHSPYSGPLRPLTTCLMSRRRSRRLCLYGEGQSSIAWRAQPSNSTALPLELGVSRSCPDMHLIQDSNAAGDFIAGKQRGMQTLQGGELRIGIARGVGLRDAAGGLSGIKGTHAARLMLCKLSINARYSTNARGLPCRADAATCKVAVRIRAWT